MNDDKERDARFEEIEDAIWGERAFEAEKEGFIGPEKSMAFLERMRNAKD